MKKYTLNSLIVLIVLIMTSCVDKIDLKLDSDEFVKLIVEGMVSDNDSIQWVNLKLTAAYDGGNSCPPAVGAIVSISEGNNLYLLNEVKPGRYETNAFIGEVGKTYKLKIEYKDEIYNAATTMQKGFAIDSVGARVFPYGLPKDMPHYEILFWGQEDPTPKQFYLFQTSINGVWNDTILSMGYINDFVSNGQYYSEEQIGIIANYLDSFEVQVKSIGVEEDYMWFLDKCIWNTMPNMFFSPPQANVKGNISNGAFGYFYSGSVNYSQKFTVKRSDFFK